MEKPNKNAKSVSRSSSYDKNIEFISPEKKGVTKEYRLLGSQRLLIAFLLGLCSFSFYAQRQSLNMTMLCMVDHKALQNLSSTHQQHHAACKIPLSSSITDEEDDEISNGPFAWNKHVQSIILGSFFWGYVFQLFGGIIAAKYGSKRTLAVAVLVSSLSTLLIPMMANYSHYYVIILRVFTGVAQGFMYPCCLPLISKWSPTNERSSLSSFLGVGSSLGVILATAITGKFCSAGLWYMNFASLACIGFVWLPFWLYYGANTPDESKHVSSEELLFIQESSEKTTDNKLKSVKDWPLKSILCSKSIWVIISTNVLSDFTLYGIFSVFPMYLWEVYNIDIVTNSYISAAEYVFMWLVTVSAGIFSDVFIRKKYLSALNTRKLFNSIGMFLPALIFPPIDYMSCDMYKVVIGLLVLGGGFPGAFINAGYLLNTVEVSGSYSGVVIGISNSMGSFSGLLAPIVANMLTKDRTQDQWRMCFTVFSGVLFLGGLIFALFSKGKLESWAKDEKQGSEEIKMMDQSSSPKLRRQYSLDSTGVLVPSISMDEYDSFQNVVLVKSTNNHQPKRYNNVQNF